MSEATAAPEMVAMRLYSPGSVVLVGSGATPAPDTPTEAI
jgi:hypothetical protein